jgi:hypothetical protein
LPLVLCAASARPEATLAVSGHVLATEPRLELSLTLANRGDRPTGPIDLTGELDGRRGESRLARGLAARAEASLVLAFAAAPRRPGLHALTLLLEHPLDGPPDGAGNPPVASELAFLPLAFGASPGEAVRIEPEPLRLDVRGSLVVRLESRDGSPLRVRLRVLAPRGLRAEGEPVEVDVPARGQATARVPILRAGAARGSRAEILLVAETPDGPLARTSVAAAAVNIDAAASRVAPFRSLLLAAGLALLCGALGYEAWARRAANHREA